MSNVPLICKLYPIQGMGGRHVLKDRGMGCANVTHLRLINSRFCDFYAKMKHFEANLMVPSRVVDSKVLRMAIQFGVFFLIKRQNG